MVLSARTFCLTVCILAFLSMAAPSSAQDRTAKAEELFKLMRMEETFAQLMDTVTQQTKASVLSQLTGRQIPPELEADVDQLQTEVNDLLMQYMGWNVLKPEYARMYADAFTDQELDAILAFYRTPGGQAFVTKQPVLIQRSSELVQRKIAEASPALQAKLASWTEKMKAKTAPR